MPSLCDPIFPLNHKPQTELTFQWRVCAWLPTWSPGRIQSMVKLTHTNRMNDRSWQRDTERHKRGISSNSESLISGARCWRMSREWRSVRFDSEQLYNWFLMWRTHIIRTDSESESHSTDIWCWLESTHSLLLVLSLSLSIPLLLSLSLSLCSSCVFSLSPCFWSSSPLPFYG